MCYVDDKEMEAGSQTVMQASRQESTGSSGCDCALTHHNIHTYDWYEVLMFFPMYIHFMHKELFSIKRLVDFLIQFDVALKTKKIIVILNTYWSYNTKCQ